MKLFRKRKSIFDNYEENVILLKNKIANETYREIDDIQLVVDSCKKELNIRVGVKTGNYYEFKIFIGDDLHCSTDISMRILEEITSGIIKNDTRVREYKILDKYIVDNIYKWEDDILIKNKKFKEDAVMRWLELRDEFNLFGSTITYFYNNFIEEY